MRGTTAVDKVIASLPRERQEAIKARGNELLALVTAHDPGRDAEGAQDQPGKSEMMRDSG